MNDHRHYLELAAASLDFELTPAERSTLENHISGCVACQRRVAALRGDADTIAHLTAFHLAESRADEILAAALRREGRRVSMQLVLIAAVVALLAGAAALIGAELLRQSREPTVLVVQPSPPVVRSPEPSIVASPEASPVIAWGARLVGTSGVFDPSGVASVASGDGRLVAVGNANCTAGSDTGARCWATVLYSADGQEWSHGGSTDETLIAVDYPATGPEPGMVDVAYGDGGFIGVGYDMREGMGAGLWHSTDGTAWERLPGADHIFDDFRFEAITSSPRGWVIVGQVFGADGPRGAIWTSPNGRAWTRIADGPVFDVGGYRDTLEEPGSGGIRDVVWGGDMLVAVGDACDDTGRACRPIVWTSPDGLTWSRSSLGGGEGRLSAVSHGSLGFIAFGTRCSPGQCGAVAYRSDDARSWEGWDMPGEDPVTSAVQSAEGVIGVAGLNGELALLGSTDGRAWAAIPLPEELAAIIDVRGVDVAVLKDAIVVVGWGGSAGDGLWVPFVVEVTPAPSA